MRQNDVAEAARAHSGTHKIHSNTLNPNIALFLIERSAQQNQFRASVACYWIVSTALVDEPKSPSVRNDRLKPTFCDTSLVTESRDSENVIK